MGPSWPHWSGQRPSHGNSKTSSFSLTLALSTSLSLVHLSTLSHQEQEGAKKRGREKELEITTSKIMEWRSSDDADHKSWGLKRKESSLPNARSKEEEKLSRR
jgi:hypothetical protein